MGITGDGAVYLGLVNQEPSAPPGIDYDVLK